MSRGRSVAQVAADVAEHKGSAVLLELLFDSGTLRLCLGRWPITLSGNTYVATGAALQVEESQEAADGVEGLTFSLSGLAAGVFDLVVTEPYQRRLVKIYEQRFDANHAPVESATLEYVGRMVRMTSTENVRSRTWTVVVQTEQFDADSERATNLRFSDAEQRRRYPDDLGAEYAASLVERVLRRTPEGT